MNNNYRLQLRHGAEGNAFSTRDDVISYINGQLQFGKVELLPYESILFFYGADDAKNTIIMVGLPEGQTYNGKKYFLVDTANLQEQINHGDSDVKDLSEKLDDEIKNRQSADEELQENIDEEKNNRLLADEGLKESIKDEATARETKDNELESAIKFNKADILSLIAACGVIYEKKLSEDRVAYTPDSHDEIIRDAKTLSDAIDKVSKFAANLGESLTISVKDSETVSLAQEADTKTGGSIISANVRIAGSDGLSKKYADNNIIGTTSDGIYAAASLEADKNHNTLIFKTSGYVDGQFKTDAYETEVTLPSYKGDSGKTTGVAVDSDSDKNVISAKLNLSSDANNILKLEDGEYVVEGIAKNIKFGDITVAKALTNHTNRLENIEEAIEDVKAIEVKGSETSTSTVRVEKSTKGDFTVSNEVKLSSDKSIVVANGGLSANVNASFKKGTSTLTINVGDTPYNIDLSELAVSVLKSATYDSVTEEIVLTFIVGDAEKTMRIPVGTLIHDIEEDDTDSIDLTIKTVQGGPNRISGEVRVDKTHSDNILTVTSNGLYVSQAYITNAVKEETESRKEADTALQKQITEISELTNTNKENISAEQTRAEKAETANANAIAQEIKDARAAEKANAGNIATNSESIKANANAIADEIARAQSAEQANVDSITAEVTRAKEAEAKNANNIDAEVKRATEKENDLFASIGTNASAIKDNKNAIDAEAKTARAAEQLNADNLTAEVLRAKDAEGENAKAISEEAFRAQKIEGELNTAITAEATTARAAEKANADNIATNKKNIEAVTSTANQNAKDIAAEITRAKGEEEKNATAVATEKDRATKTESELEGKITVEKERATKAEGDNTTAIATLNTTVATIKDSLTKEITRATGTDTNLQKDIDGEISRAKDSEATLQSNIDKNTQNITALSTSIGNIELKKEGDLAYALYVNGTKHGEFVIPQDQFLKSVNYDVVTKTLIFVFNTSSGEVTQKVSIADLIDTYTNGEGILLNANVFSIDFSKVASLESLNTEVTRAKTEENKLETAISTNTKSITDETVRAQEAEQANTNAITVEVNRAKKAESDNANAISAEVTRATEKENDLFASIGINASAIKDNKNAIDAEAKNARAAEKSNADAITAEVSRAKEAEGANTKAISEEVLRATDAEDKLSDAITAETKRAQDNEKVNADNIATNKKNIETVTSTANKNATDIAAEITRAKGEEAKNATAVETEKDRATKAESELEGKITTNANNLTAETTRAKSEEKANNDAIKAEASTARAAEKANHDAIDAELKRASTAESNLDIKITALTGTLNTSLETLEGKITAEATTARAAEKANAKSITEEIARAQKTEETNAANIATKANASDVYTKNEITTTLGSYAKTVDVQSSLDNKLNVADAKNVYASKEALQEVKDSYATKTYVDAQDTEISKQVTSNTTAIDNFNIAYNSATSELVFTDKGGIKNTYKLYSGSLVKSGTFDTKTNSIVLTIETAGVESQITIPVSELLSDISAKIDTNAQNITTINDTVKGLAKKWSTNNSSTVSFTKTDGTETDTLTASVIVATSDKQAIQSTDTGLYVSNDLDSYTCDFGTEGKISGQLAIDKLREKLAALETKVEKYETQIATLTDALAKIKLVTGYESYTNAKNMSVRLDELTDTSTDVNEEIENIENNLIGSKDNPVEGSVWYQINGMVDAGTFTI